MDFKRSYIHDIARTYLDDAKYDNTCYEKHDNYALKSLEIAELISDGKPEITWSNLSILICKQKYKK